MYRDCSLLDGDSYDPTAGTGAFVGAVAGVGGMVFTVRSSSTASVLNDISLSPEDVAVGPESFVPPVLSTMLCPFNDRSVINGTKLEPNGVWEARSNIEGTWLVITCCKVSSKI